MATATLLHSLYTEPRDVMLGVYDKTQGSSSGMARVKAMDSFTGRHTAVVLQFSNLSSTDIGAQGAAIVAAHRIPMFTCEPWLGVVVGTRGVVKGHCQQVVSGSHDNDLIAYAKAVAAFGSCYVRFAHEMNGNWYPWAGDPVGYVAMWKYVDAIFQQYAPHAHLVWCVNSGDVGPWQAEQFFPGTALVDMVAIDGYSNGVSPQQVFEGMRLRVTAITKLPIAITEVGVVNSPTKGMWITSFYQYAAPLYKMLIWYNKDIGTSTWGIFGESGGNMVWQGFNCYREQASAVVAVDSMY